MALAGLQEIHCRITRWRRISSNGFCIPSSSRWYSRGVGYTVRSTIDGLVYGLLVGGAFGWLWP
ncbi:MAG TPA: hypothetical protein VGL98_05885 [Gammaproteobacteria bacterium]